MKASHRICLALGLLAFFALAGCRSAYYSTMETFGVEKRDILVDRVEDARDAQEDAKEQFSSALEEFSALVDFEGGDLEEIYNRLNSELERSEAAAQRISERVDAVEQVAKDLFNEWNEELDQYENERLRRQSQAQLERTVDQYDDLIGHMRRAEARVDPVLANFKDQVLFLKHNLNAQAISALEDEAVRVQTDVEELIEHMQTAIDEANGFIESMQ